MKSYWCHFSKFCRAQDSGKLNHWSRNDAISLRFAELKTAGLNFQVNLTVVCVWRGRRRLAFREEQSPPPLLGVNNFQGHIQGHIQSLVSRFQTWINPCFSLSISGIVAVDMKNRRTQIEDDGPTTVLVRDLHTKEWLPIPHGIGCTVLGFPCTPWSLTLGVFNLLMQHHTHGTEILSPC